jgi:O-succinylbenzoate synthase
VWFSPYTLSARASLNAKSISRAREGALLRFEFAEGFGYADLHPWIELGDASLADQLKALTAGQPLKLGTRSQALAHEDAKARAQGKNAFARASIDNHYLVTDLDNLLEAEPKSLGFSTLKIKVGRDLEHELQKLAQLTAYRLRLDFNGTATIASFAKFVQALSPALRDAIEFVEDPTSHVREWKKLPLQEKLALDRPKDHDEENPAPFAYRIFKPATQEPTEVLSQMQRIVTTSYLDHPVGQMGAMIEASRLKDPGICGLASHFAYEANAYSERLSMRGSQLLAPTEQGIGFTDLLEKENWKELR